MAERSIKTTNTVAETLIQLSKNRNDKMNVSVDKYSPIQDQNELSNSNAKFPEAQSRKDPKAQEPAWEMLEAQNPNYLECYQCRKHHPLSNIHKFASSKNQPFALTACMKLDQKYRTAKFIHPDFRFTVFRMIMKQYRLKRDCTKLLELLSYWSGVLMDRSQVKQVIATPKIIAGRFLMRVQTAYVIPPTRESRIYLANKNHLKCPHSSKHTFNNRQLARKILIQFATLKDLPEDQQEILMCAECKRCFTKFQVGLQHFNGHGVMMFITKWQDLGTGLSPLESDIPRLVAPQLYPCWGVEGRKLMLESLRFEGQEFDSSSSLTSKERMDQFEKSNSKDAQIRRAKETFYWRWWGRQVIFPHQYARKETI